MADWLPGWTRYLFNLRGKPYQFTHNPKGCLHTTEGSSIAGALAAYAPYPPHGIYDWRTRERLQHIPLSLASYSAMDGNDDDYMVQIELVGHAAESRFWPDEAWRNIAEDVLKPIEDNFGVPRRALGFKDARDGVSPPLATASSPIRLGWASLRDYSGWLGHQHLPAPDEHWDPGAIQISKGFALMSGSVEEEDDDMIRFIQATGDPKLYALTAEGIRPVDNMEEFELYKAVTGRGVHSVTPQVLAKLTKSGASVWNYTIPVSDSNPFGQPFRPAHRVVAGIYEKASSVVADVDEEALAAALEARGIDGASPAEVKQAMIEVLKSVS